ncbi:hypothetical protein RND81_11G185300 [Saponaria officinalis]|uniref:Uncharacterized protein n=1 Tax=Saponaria officinalis TaxID=3572 RepID=A0AAW1HMW2_SAPOF
MIETIKNTILSYMMSTRMFFGESSPPVRNISNYDHILGVNGEMEDEGNYTAFLSKNRKVHADKSELELYLEEKNMDLNKDMKQSELERFSCLSCLARDIFNYSSLHGPFRICF